MKTNVKNKVVGDGSMITGWDYAIRSMEVGERALIRVVDTDNLGYGQQGVPPLIRPNQQLEFDITLLDCQPPTLNIDFDSIATLDNTPVRDYCTVSFHAPQWIPARRIVLI